MAARRHVTNKLRTAYRKASKADKAEIARHDDEIGLNRYDEDGCYVEEPLLDDEPDLGEDG
ncbi:hypothetical protein SAMN05443377_11723 [Propionibacterium cyclohexanicum]|uniref:Uncharacterized protein n=1 Tax=Propionibacterium cyclohexanicum TaxID=64702 RepID=A0A1H9SYC3_9ACTN|nr:hypothetical protein [Propionibacterium cyclohexanicum]SER90030.1 hypothetical protein SAMN05443377_11723 [Propionibacterium cyclohexanicum]